MSLASEGSGRVDQATDAIRKIATTVSDASARIHALEERASQVSSIANVIKGNRRPDQPAGAERGDRAAARRRTGARLRGRCRRSAQARRTDLVGDAGNRGDDPGHPGRHQRRRGGDERRAAGSGTGRAAGRARFGIALQHRERRRAHAGAHRRRGQRHARAERGRTSIAQRVGEIAQMVDKPPPPSRTADPRSSWNRSRRLKGKSGAQRSDHATQHHGTARPSPPINRRVPAATRAFVSSLPADQQHLPALQRV